jgi:hypothetical protein
LSRHRTATLEPTEPASDPASDLGHRSASASRKGPSFSGGSRNTGPLTKPRSARKKKGLLRRTGVVFPAIGLASFLVFIVTVVAYMMSPSSSSGAAGLTPFLNALPHSHSITLLEQERQQLIVMNVAAQTLSSVAKPAMVSPDKVLQSMQASSATSTSGTGSTSSSSGSTTSNAPAAPPPDPGSAKSIAYKMLPSYGFNQGSQYSCLVSLWNRESNWRWDAENASGAYGIPQSLPGSKMASAGSDWRTNPATQIKWGLTYISQIYGTPCGAWSHEESSGWY